jgi:hypothetical protein
MYEMLFPDKYWVVSLIKTNDSLLITSSASVFVSKTSTMASIGGKGKELVFSL